MWTAASGLLVQPVWGGKAADDRTTALVPVAPGPGLVHGVARGGTHVALVVGGPP
jgi:hypothetical protein